MADNVGLIPFMTARLDEDEAGADEVHLPGACGSVDRDGEFSPDPVYCGCRYPDRVRREVAAKRARLALFDEALTEMDRMLADDDADRTERARAIGRQEAARAAVKIDAAVYSDHPDYRREWDAADRASA